MTGSSWMGDGESNKKLSPGEQRVAGDSWFPLPMPLRSYPEEEDLGHGLCALGTIGALYWCLRPISERLKQPCRLLTTWQVPCATAQRCWVCWTQTAPRRTMFTMSLDKPQSMTHKSCLGNAVLPVCLPSSSRASPPAGWDFLTPPEPTVGIAFLLDKHGAFQCQDRRQPRALLYISRFGLFSLAHTNPSPSLF